MNHGDQVPYHRYLRSQPAPLQRVLFDIDRHEDKFSLPLSTLMGLNYVPS